MHVNLVIVMYTNHNTNQSCLGSCAAPATAASSAAETTAAAGTAAALRQTDYCFRQPIVLEVSLLEILILTDYCFRQAIVLEVSLLEILILIHQHSSTTTSCAVRRNVSDVRRLMSLTGFPCC